MSDADQPTETEIKLRLPPESVATLEQHLMTATADPPQLQRLVSTYFDTSDMALSRKGVSLRVRSDGARHVQTVKTRATGDSVAQRRGEWESAVASDQPDMAQLTATPVAELLGAAKQTSLRPIFTTEVCRSKRNVYLEDGTVAELAIDRGEIVADTAREPLSELELELKRGETGPLYRLALELAAAVPLSLEPASKAERGFRLCTGKAPQAVKAADLSLSSEVNAARGFAQIVRAAVQHLLANMPASALGDAEGVHQLRIAIRRLRAALVLFRPMLQPDATQGFNNALRHIGHVFGNARDWDVFVLETLPKASPHVPMPEWLHLLTNAAEARRATAQRAAAEAQQGRGFTMLVLGVSAWIEDGLRRPTLLGHGPWHLPLTEVAPDLLDRLARKVAHRGRCIGDASLQELHALRKATKKLRYSVEFVAPLHRRKAIWAYLQPCKVLLKLLGKLNDTAMTESLAAQLAEAEHPDLAPALGMLTDWCAHRRSKALHKLPKAWHAFRDADAFWQ